MLVFQLTNNNMGVLILSPLCFWDGLKSHFFDVYGNPLGLDLCASHSTSWGLHEARLVSSRHWTRLWLDCNVLLSPTFLWWERRVARRTHIHVHISAVAGSSTEIRTVWWMHPRMPWLGSHFYWTMGSYHLQCVLRGRMLMRFRWILEDLPPHPMPLSMGWLLQMQPEVTECRVATCFQSQFVAL